MYKLFSQRKKEEIKELDVFVYDVFSEAFRNQFFHILCDIFDDTKQVAYYSYDLNVIDFWKLICEQFSREKGLKYIPEPYSNYYNNMEALTHYIDTCNDVDFLDLMDFVVVNIICSDYIKKAIKAGALENAIIELNYRFKTNSLGYECINGKLIVKTNTVMHNEVIKPALVLLSDKKFSGAEQEYLKAFDCFKKGDNKNAIMEAIKSFESTMKIICKEKKYPFDAKKDTASKLLSILEANSFYPAYLNSHMGGVKATLESGAPTLRNKLAGHGQGDVIVEIPDEIVEYALNLVATNIVFLVKLYNTKRKKQ